MHSKTIYRYRNPFTLYKIKFFVKNFKFTKFTKQLWRPSRESLQPACSYMTRPLMKYLISYIFHVQAKKIDVFSRVLFPFCFAIFNAWYWSYYLSKASSQKKGTKTFSVPGFLTLLSPTWALLGPT